MSIIIVKFYGRLLYISKQHKAVEHIFPIYISAQFIAAVGKFSAAYFAVSQTFPVSNPASDVDATHAFPSLCRKWQHMNLLEIEEHVRVVGSEILAETNESQ